MISVAMCTYNGERFLAQQLASIQQQTRLPEELVICDDGSTDGTVSIVREFASSASFPVKLIENEQNLGSTRNFEKAMRLCSGDLIALSDQDDVWHPTRLQRSEREMQTHPAAGLTFSDGEMIDDQGQALGRRMWESALFSSSRRRELAEGNYDLLFQYRFVTGAALMFRAALRDRCLPVPPGWIHDEWLAAMVPAFADLAPIDEPLIFYRKHVSQQIGLSAQAAPRLTMKDHWRTLREGDKTDRYWSQLAKNVRFAQAVCGRLSEASLDERGRKVLADYQAWLRFAEFRLHMPRRRLRRAAAVLKRYRWYSRHALGARSVLKDLVRSLPPAIV